MSNLSLPEGPIFKSGYISIQDETGKELFRKNVTQDSEINDFVIQYGKTINGYGLFPALICPLNLKGRAFVKDFFCPTLQKANMPWILAELSLKHIKK